MQQISRRPWAKRLCVATKNPRPNRITTAFYQKNAKNTPKTATKHPKPTEITQTNPRYPPKQSAQGPRGRGGEKTKGHHPPGGGGKKSRTKNATRGPPTNQIPKTRRREGKKHPTAPKTHPTDPKPQKPPEPGETRTQPKPTNPHQNGPPQATQPTPRATNRTQTRPNPKTHQTAPARQTPHRPTDTTNQTDQPSRRHQGDPPGPPLTKKRWSVACQGSKENKTKQAKTTKLPWKAFRHRQETHMELSRRDPEGYVLPVRRAHIRALQSSGRIREKGSWKTYRTALSIPDMEAKVAPGKLIHALKFHNHLLCNLVLRFISLVWFVGSWFMVV